MIDLLSTALVTLTSYGLSSLFGSSEKKRAEGIQRTVDRLNKYLDYVNQAPLSRLKELLDDPNVTNRVWNFSGIFGNGGDFASHDLPSDTNWSKADLYNYVQNVYNEKVQSQSGQLLGDQLSQEILRIETENQNLKNLLAQDQQETAMFYNYANEKTADQGSTILETTYKEETTEPKKESNIIYVLAFGLILLSFMRKA